MSDSIATDYRFSHVHTLSTVMDDFKLEMYPSWDTMLNTRKKWRTMLLSMYSTSVVYNRLADTRVHHKYRLVEGREIDRTAGA